MVKTKETDDGKIDSLKKYGALNPHPQKVTEQIFSDSEADFFDSRDLVQVKYEMLRAVEKESQSVKQASEAFGFSRPMFDIAITEVFYRKRLKYIIESIVLTQASL